MRWHNINPWLVNREGQIIAVVDVNTWRWPKVVHQQYPFVPPHKATQLALHTTRSTRMQKDQEPSAQGYMPHLAFTQIRNMSKCVCYAKKEHLLRQCAVFPWPRALWHSVPLRPSSCGFCNAILCTFFAVLSEPSKHHLHAMQFWCALACVGFTVRQTEKGIVHVNKKKMGIETFNKGKS